MKYLAMAAILVSLGCATDPYKVCDENEVTEAGHAQCVANVQRNEQQKYLMYRTMYPNGIQTYRPQQFQNYYTPPAQPVTQWNPTPAYSAPQVNIQNNAARPATNPLQNISTQHRYGCTPNTDGGVTCIGN